MKTRLLLLVFSFLTFVVHAEWQGTSHGDHSPNLVAADASGNRIVLSLRQQSGVWFTNDGGENWEQINHRLTDAPVIQSATYGSMKTIGPMADTLIVDIFPYFDNIPYYKECHSFDGGETWSSYTDIVTSFWPDSLDLITLGGDPTMIYPDRVYYSRQSGFGISHDQGATWTIVDVDSFECGTRGVLFSETEPDTIFLYGAWGPLTIGGPVVGGVSASYDGGYTWRELTHMPDLTTETRGTVEDLQWGYGNNLYAMTGHLASDPFEPVLRSQDHGETWEWMESHGLPESMRASKYLAVPESPGRILAAESGEFGVWISDDHGQNWSRLLNGLPEIPDGVGNFYRNPYSGHLYVCLKNQGVFRSTDFGESWHQISMPPVGTKIGDPYRGIITEDGGVMHGSQQAPIFYVAGSDVDFHSIPMLGTDPNKSYRCYPISYHQQSITTMVERVDIYSYIREFAILKSLDGGANWEFNDNVPASIVEIVPVVNDTSLVLAGKTNGSQLYLSDNYGSNWQLNQIPVIMHSYRHLQSYENMLLAECTYPTQDIYLSEDMGLNWEALQFPEISNLTGATPAPFKILNDTLFVRYYRYLWAYPLHQQVVGWSLRSTLPGIILASYDIAWEIVDDGINRIFISGHTKSHELLVSYDYGFTWEEQEIIMPPGRQGEVAIDIAYDKWRDRLWIDTGVGLAYLDNPTTRVGEDAWTFQPATYATMSSYPNPFNANTTVQYTLTQPGDVKLEVYDLLGRRVATLVDGMTAPGGHSVSFDAGELSSGSYFLRLNTPEQTLHRRITLVK
ncbi:T9SS type A sorting domain-containing protein [bacterium]|nr:T9SS type A sorting domain-containing protein [bacterium]